MIVWGTYNSFGVFFNSLLTEFQWSRAVTSGAFSLCTILSGLTAIPLGRITDKFGPRAVMTICSLFLGTGYILMSAINTVWQFYIVYGVIIGIGTAGFWVPVLSTVSRWFVQRRGLMVGTVLTGSGAGTIIFPPITNWLITSYNWRISIIIVGVVTLLAGTLMSQFIRRDPYQIGQLPDGSTAILKTGNTILNEGYSLKEAISTPQLWMAALIFFCCGYYGYTVLVHIIPHALFSGISSTTATGILSIIGGLSIVGGLFAGAITDKIGIRRSMAGFLIIAVAALTWLIFAVEIWQLYLFAVVMGFTYGSIGTVETISSVWLFGLKANAIILSIIDFGLTAGAALGPFIAGYIFDVSQNYRSAFILTAAVGAAGLLLSLLIKPPEKTT
jgi:MFS family permease